MRQTSHLLQPNSILCVYLLAACTLLLITFGMQSLVLPCKTCNVNYFKTNSRHVGSYISWGESKYSIQYEIILIFLKMFIEMLDLLTAGVVCMHTPITGSEAYYRVGASLIQVFFFSLFSRVFLTLPLPVTLYLAWWYHPLSCQPAAYLPACRDSSLLLPWRHLSHGYHVIDIHQVMRHNASSTC